MHAKLLPLVLAKLDIQKGPDSEGNYICRCIYHEDGTRWNLRVSEKGYYCHVCNSLNISSGGGLWKLAVDLGLDPKSQLPKQGGIAKTWDYVDEQGKLLFQVVKTSDKKFWQRRWDADKGDWENKVKGTRRVLYNLPQLHEARLTERPIFLCEGEKDCDNLKKLNVLTTTNAGGAGKWLKTYTKYLTGRKVIILPDNDAPGNGHAIKVATALFNQAKSVRILRLPGLPNKGDVTDWIKSGGTKNELIQLTKALRPLTAETLEAEVANLEKIQEGAKPQETEEDKLSIVAAISQLVLQQDIVLFRDQYEDPFMAIKDAKGQLSVVSLQSRRFTRWVRRLAYESAQLTPGLQVITTVAEHLDSVECGKNQIDLNIRSAYHNDAIYINIKTDAFIGDLRIASGDEE